MKSWCKFDFRNVNCKLKPLQKQPKFNIETIEQNYMSKVHQMFKKTEDVTVFWNNKKFSASWWEYFCMSTTIIIWIKMNLFILSPSHLHFMHCTSFKGHEWGVGCNILTSLCTHCLLCSFKALLWLHFSQNILESPIWRLSN